MRYFRVIDRYIFQNFLLRKIVDIHIFFSVTEIEFEFSQKVAKTVRISSKNNKKCVNFLRRSGNKLEFNQSAGKTFCKFHQRITKKNNAVVSLENSTHTNIYIYY